MTEKEVQEHMCKEFLKSVVDNAPSFSDKVKFDLKWIIDCGKSPVEISEGIITYFAMSNFRIQSNGLN